MPICENCKKEFEQNNHYQRTVQKYCSEQCRKEGLSKYRRDYMRQYMRTHPNIKKESQERIRKQKIDVLIHYGGDPPKCACCDENHIEFLTIDHINGNGAEHRRQIGGTQKFSGLLFYEWIIANNYPEGYQVLCSNCNTAKRNSIAKFCPVHHPELYLKE
jgi:hypothetical protein